MNDLQPHDAGSSAQTIAELLHTSRLLVCVGPGGVGKTTTSAALGLRAALMGRKTIVLTIDPAKRLANSLGLDSLTNQPQKISLEALDSYALDNNDSPGELWAMMLDSKQTFDDLVRQHAPDSGALQKAEENNIYRLLSSALHGMQEYMALEKLHDLYTGGYFDLVVLDTPPTKNALEFLQTPNRASQFFDDRIMRWFLPGEKKGIFGKVLNPGAIVLGLLSKLFGDSFVKDLTEFFDTFQYLQETLKHRGDMIQFILKDTQTHFLVITSADPRRIKEAVYFHERLAELNQHADVFIINRMIPEFASQDIAQVNEQALNDLLHQHGMTTPEAVDSMRERLQTHYEHLATLAARDREAVKRMASAVGAKTLSLIPMLSEDVHNISHLLKLSHFLTPKQPATPSVAE